MHMYKIRKTLSYWNKNEARVIIDKYKSLITDSNIKSYYDILLNIIDSRINILKKIKWEMIKEYKTKTINSFIIDKIKTDSFIIDKIKTLTKPSDYDIIIKQLSTYTNLNMEYKKEFIINKIKEYKTKTVDSFIIDNIISIPNISESDLESDSESDSEIDKEMDLEDYIGSKMPKNNITESDYESDSKSDSDLD